ncbi:MAG: hypothetical protein L6Q35_10010 [Phycisphaerales bacterium]|nr:hypothetical protein [Phycisphaerales bacterium]
MNRCNRSVWAFVLSLLVVAVSRAQPSLVEHAPSAPTFNQPPGVTQREPDVPREDESVDLYLRVSFQFTYDRVCVYYTTDGTEPSGSFGNPTGTTQVLRNDLGTVTFLYNENNAGVRDWWKATLPDQTRGYAQHIKYKVSAWKPFNGPEVFASGGLSFSFLNKLAWPGAGAGSAAPAAGYPDVSFWKEEAIIGNTFCAAMLDQNGTYYDFHFPTPGCVYGVGTRNEGYVDGQDTFPPLLPPGRRGQMHLNQAMPGIRVDGLTHWLSNPQGVSYSSVSQSYVDDSNTVLTSQHLVTSDSHLFVEQSDFAPAGISFPSDQGSNPQRHLAIKRLRITNLGGSSRSVNVYWYLDPALNGSDNYDVMTVDPARGAMIASDTAYRVVTGTGAGFPDSDEYNPTTSSGYEKNKSLVLACAMKTLAAPGASGGQLSSESWRDTSADNTQGWIGQKVTVAAGATVEVDFLMAGAIDNFAGATGTYSFQLAPVIDWFQAQSASAVELSTNGHWSQWLDAGVTVDTPDDTYDRLVRRGLLATALHLDGVNGGVIAGFHNGAYPFVWPRDAVYAAVTLARTGHLDEARAVYDWMKNTTYRDFEPWGRKGFWKQKYSTDGYVIWGAPQIDETAVFPWGVWYQYMATADSAMVLSYVDQVRDSVESMTRDSSDSRLRFEEAFNLVYSNNVWEDSYDTFIYSNANVARGLADAAKIFGILGLASEASNAAAKSALIKSGLDARLDWNGENTDVSQLGIVYPFEVYAANDARAARVVDRINGVATDAFGNNHPLVNFTGEHMNTINRYWSDTYWNGGPWFLSTLWYGLYYAARADLTPGTADIDNHKSRIDLCIDRLGPAGLGAEQIAYGTGPGASLLYPGQQDFKLQAAWPNAWESMSTLVDSVMAFLDFTPAAPSRTFRVEPKLPSAWQTITFHGLTMRHAPTGDLLRADITIDQSGVNTVVLDAVNLTGAAANLEAVIRVPAGKCITWVRRNGVDWPYAYQDSTGRVSLDAAPLQTGIGSITSFSVGYSRTADFDSSGFVDIEDFTSFVLAFEAGDESADFDGTGFVDTEDYDAFVRTFEIGC